MSQDVTLAASTTYRLRMRVNSRRLSGADPYAIFSASVNGSQVIAPTDAPPAGAAPCYLLEGTFASPGGGAVPLDITITPSGAGDMTGLIDAVSLVVDGQPEPFTLNTAPPAITYHKWMAARIGSRTTPQDFVDANYLDADAFPYGEIPGAANDGGRGRNRMIGLDEDNNVYYWNSRDPIAGRLFQFNIDDSPASVSANVLLTGPEIVSTIAPTVSQPEAGQLAAAGGGIRAGAIDPSGDTIYLVAGALDQDVGVAYLSPTWILRHDIVADTTTVVARGEGIADIVVDDQFIYAAFATEVISNADPFGGTGGVDMIARLPVSSVNATQGDFTVLAASAALQQAISSPNVAVSLLALAPNGDLYAAEQWTRQILKVTSPATSPSLSVFLSSIDLDATPLGYVGPSGLAVSSAGQVIVADDVAYTGPGGNLPGDRGIAIFDSAGTLVGTHGNGAFNTRTGVNTSYRNYRFGVRDDQTGLEQRGGPTNKLKMRADGLFAVGFNSQAGNNDGRNSTAVFRSNLIETAGASVANWTQFD